MTYTFEEAPTRDQVWLRAFLMGPTGSGKSRGALELATRIFDGVLPVTLINTERGRGKLYADRYKLHGYVGMDERGDFSPEAYIAAIDIAEERTRGGVIVIDSTSHEWMGAKGILQEADRFGEWKTVRPRHNSWVDRLLAVEAHLIVTCRAKMKYEVGEEERSGQKRQVIRMLGVGPIQSDDLQYEFNLVGRFEQGTHDVEFSGHVDPLVDTVTNLGDPVEAVAVAEKLTRWLSEGDPVEPPAEAEPERVAELLASLRRERELGNARMTDETIEQTLAKARTLNRGVLSPEYVEEQLGKSLERVAAAEAKAAGAGQDAADLVGAERE